MSSKQKNWQKRRDHYANQYFINAGNYKTFCDHEGEAVSIERLNELRKKYPDIPVYFDPNH